MARIATSTGSYDIFHKGIAEASPLHYQFIADGAGRTFTFEAYRRDGVYMGSQTGTIGATATLFDDIPGVTGTNVVGIIITAITGGNIYYRPTNDEITDIDTSTGVLLAVGDDFGDVPETAKARIGATTSISAGGGGRKTITANFTRPNDTTPYTIGDVICNSTSAPVVMTFSNAVRAIGRGATILSAALVQSAAQSTKLSATLFLFDTTVTIDNDNDDFTPTDAEMYTLIGTITFDGDQAIVGDGNVTISGVVGENGNITFAGVSTSIFGVLVADNAYTPTAQEVFYVRLGIDRD